MMASDKEKIEQFRKDLEFHLFAVNYALKDVKCSLRSPRDTYSLGYLHGQQRTINLLISVFDDIFKADNNCSIHSDQMLKTIEECIDELIEFCEKEKK